MLYPAELPSLAAAQNGRARPLLQVERCMPGALVEGHLFAYTPRRCAPPLFIEGIPLTGARGQRPRLQEADPHPEH
jgi:hypothetical protein